MSDFILVNEPVIRILSFASVLSLMAIWEILASRRPQVIKRLVRWPGNLAIVILDTLAVRLFFPLAAVGAAIYASEHGWGLLNLVSMPGWVAVILAILALDLAIYFQHRIFHAVPWLWRLLLVTPDMHRVHHSAIQRETDSNFGFSIPWWDRLFGTYRAQPEKGHLGMTIGIENFRTEHDLRLDQMLVQPFRHTASRPTHSGQHHDTGTV